MESVGPTWVQKTGAQVDLYTVVAIQLQILFRMQVMKLLHFFVH